MIQLLALLFTFIASVCAQQVGTYQTETHPDLPVQSCTADGSCTTLNTKIVLDANWRWLHSTSSSTNCYTGNTWNTNLCPDGATCAANCALEGADYRNTYGITTSGNSLKLGFVTQSAQKNIGSRVYLMDTTDSAYKMFKVKGQEFTFDADVSNLPCGLNGALYLAQIDADGGLKYPGNKAGAKYGTGYCDAQCPHDIKFINGEANSAGWIPSSNDVNTGTGAYGSCCSEMDIWEANSISSAYTPHICTSTGQTRCSGSSCGDDASGERYDRICDKDGCDYNSYRMGNTSFYGPSKIVDTTKPFTVVTQFITNDGTTTGTLTEIKRFYVQNGIVIPNSVSNIAGIDAVNSISDGFCNQQKTAFGDTNDFVRKGGLAAMGDALDRGMVLVLSLWDDKAVNMLWLDSTYPTDSTNPGAVRGTCDINSGKPADVEANVPNSSVTFSKIKIGPIGSTFKGASSSIGPGNTSSTLRSSPTIKSSSAARSSSSTSITVPAATPSLDEALYEVIWDCGGSRVLTPSNTAKTTTSAKATSTPATGGATVAKWGQCGGIGYTGATDCATGSACTYSNPWYSQCL